MSKQSSFPSSEKLFNISKEYKKHYKLGHSFPSKDACIPVYSKNSQCYKGTGSTPTKVLSASHY